MMYITMAKDSLVISIREGVQLMIVEVRKQ